VDLLNNPVTGQIGREYQNPPDARYFGLIASVCLMSFLLGIVGFYLKGGSVLILSIMWVIGALGLYIIWWREYYHRPRTVTINEGGIVITFRYSRAKFVPWEGIIGVCSNPGHPKNPNEGWRGNGGLILGSGHAYQLTYSIAIAIRDGYKERFSHPPHEWNGYDSSRKFRKKIGP